jgi:hypothetical protein
MMTTTEKITFWVNEFLADSDAILSMREDGTGDHWRAQMMAKRCLMADVEKLKTWGVLPYLHDASTLKGVSK